MKLKLKLDLNLFHRQSNPSFSNLTALVYSFTWDTILNIFVFLGAVFLLHFLGFNTMYSTDKRNYFWCRGSVLAAAVNLGFYTLCWHYLEHYTKANQNYAGIMLRETGLFPGFEQAKSNL